MMLEKLRKETRPLSPLCDLPLDPLEADDVDPFADTEEDNEELD